MKLMCACDRRWLVYILIFASLCLPSPGVKRKLEPDDEEVLPLEMELLLGVGLPLRNQLS